MTVLLHNLYPSLYRSVLVPCFAANLCNAYYQDGVEPADYRNLQIPLEVEEPTPDIQ